MGRVNRNVFYKKIKINYNIVNVSFLGTGDEIFKKFKLTHQQCKPCLESGYTAVQHYSKIPPRDFDRDAMEFAYQSMHTMFYPYVNNSCLTSMEDVKTNINKQTSCGYPYNISSEFKDKQKFFDLPNWIGIIESMEQLAIDNPEFKIFWQVSQKYELRGIDKLNLPIQKIRVFLSAPVDFVILQNKYCLGFNKRMMRAYRETWSKLGMSKYRMGWQELLNYFNGYNNVFSVDGEKFDTTISYVFTDQIRRFRSECMDPVVGQGQVKAVLKFIYNNVQNSLLVLEHGDLVLKTMGNTSGQANTLDDNTLASFLGCSYCYYRTCDSAGILPSYNHMLKVMRCAIVGDDLILGLNDSNRNFLNFQVMEKAYHEIGMKLTLESNELIPLEQGEFLSTKFIKNSTYGVYAPLMNRNKMYSGLMVGDSSDDPRWVLLRVYAYRIECWADKEMITLLLKFESFIFTQYSSKLNGELYAGKEKQLVLFSDIQAMRLSDAELDYLYFGYESFDLSFMKVRNPIEVQIVVSKIGHLLNDISQFKFISLWK
jgi:hypothetical protein